MNIYTYGILDRRHPIAPHDYVLHAKAIGNYIKQYCSNATLHMQAPY